MRLNVNWVLVAVTVFAVSWGWAQEKPKPMPPVKEPPVIQDGPKLPKPEPAQKLVRTERLEIADKDGNTRIVLGTGANTLGEFTMLTKSGKPALKMTHLNDHQWLMSVLDETGTPLLQVSSGQNWIEVTSATRKEGTLNGTISIMNSAGNVTYKFAGHSGISETGSFGEKGVVQLNNLGGSAGEKAYTLDNGKWYRTDPDRR